jgi:hypothetical protein
MIVETSKKQVQFHYSVCNLIEVVSTILQNEKMCDSKLRISEAPKKSQSEL